jgi:hypothetical protein
MVSLVVFMMRVTHCIMYKVCNVIIMYNRSSSMYLFVSVGYKRKESFIIGFLLCFLVRKK